MNSTHFDLWTRRRFGLAAGGAITTLISLVTADAVDARNEKRKKRRRRKDRRQDRRQDHDAQCLTLHQTCQAGDPNQHCCSGLTCGEPRSPGSTQCCGERRATCDEHTDCCGDLLCGEAIGLQGPHCCADFGSACVDDRDCCQQGALCNPFTLTCELVA